MRKLKKFFIVLGSMLMIIVLCPPVVYAADGDTASAGNFFIWFLCAIAFLKVSQKMDSILSSMGLNMTSSGKSMLADAMIAAKGFSTAKGIMSGRSGDSSSGGRNNSGYSPLGGGLAGAVGRMAINSMGSGGNTETLAGAASKAIFQSSLSKGGAFAAGVIGSIANGEISQTGTLKGAEAVSAFSQYMGLDSQEALEKPSIHEEENASMNTSSGESNNSVSSIAGNSIKSAHAALPQTPEIQSNNINASQPMMSPVSGENTASAQEMTIPDYNNGIAEASTLSEVGEQDTTQQEMTIPAYNNGRAETGTLPETGIQDTMQPEMAMPNHNNGIAGTGILSEAGIQGVSQQNMAIPEYNSQHTAGQSVMEAGLKPNSQSVATGSLENNSNFGAPKKHMKPFGLNVDVAQGLNAGMSSVIPSRGTAAVPNSSSEPSSAALHQVSAPIAGAGDSQGYSEISNSSSTIAQAPISTESTEEGDFNSPATNIPASSGDISIPSYNTMNSVEAEEMVHSSDSVVQAAGSVSTAPYESTSDGSQGASVGYDSSSIVDQPQESVSIPTYSNVEIGGGRIAGVEHSPENPSGIQFSLYSCEKYMEPTGNYSMQTSVDGKKWYKQYATDTVSKTPYMDGEGKIKYKESLVKQLPAMPKRKDRV